MASRSSATSPVSAPRDGRPVPLRAIAIPLAAGWALLSVAALAAQDPFGIVRAAVAVGVAAVVALAG